MVASLAVAWGGLLARGARLLRESRLGGLGIGDELVELVGREAAQDLGPGRCPRTAVALRGVEQRLLHLGQGDVALDRVVVEAQRLVEATVAGRARGRLAGGLLALDSATRTFCASSAFARSNPTFSDCSLAISFSLSVIFAS